MEAFGRMAHAMYLAKDAGSGAHVVLMGAAVRWPLFFAEKEPNPFREYFAPIFSASKPVVCGGSADKFGVADDLKKAGVQVRGGAGDHVSIAGLVAEGYHIVTF